MCGSAVSHANTKLPAAKYMASKVRLLKAIEPALAFWFWEWKKINIVVNLLPTLNSIIKLMFHGNQLRKVSFQTQQNSLVNKTTKRLCVVVFQIKLESALRHEDWEIEELKIRTTIHKLAMITFYVLVSARLSEK